MNINNQGQVFSRISVASGQLLPQGKAGTIKSGGESGVIEPKPPQLPPKYTKILPLPPKIEPMPPIHRAFEAVKIEPVTAQIDPGNMTPAEFRQMMQSEFSRERNELSGSLDVMPYWEYRFDSAFRDMPQLADVPEDKKLDMLTIIEKAIETNTEKNLPVAQLERALTKLKEIDGQAFLNSINLSA